MDSSDSEKEKMQPLEVSDELFGELKAPKVDD